MPPALQLPVRRTPAESLGKRLFRKQLLPVGSISYEGRRIEFSADYLKRLAENFKRSAFDQVPFVLADKEGKHSQDPSKFRGDVMGLEFTGDGLDAIVEMTDEGAQLVRDNPRLGVSARIVEETRSEIDTPRAVPAVQHVCATFDPRLPGLRDWEMASDLSSSYAPEQVIDLTAATYQEMPGTDANIKLTDEQRTKLLKLVGDDGDLKAGVEKLLGKSDGGEGTEAAAAAAKAEEEAKAEAAKPGKLATVLARLTGRDASDFNDEKLAELAEVDAGKSEEEEAGKEPVALSAAAQKAVDLAASDSAQAKKDAADAKAEAAELRFDKAKAQYTKDGVTPALVDLCAPVLKRGPSNGVIELSAGENFDLYKFVTGILDEAKGTIDLTGARGSSVQDDDPERTEAKDLAKKLGEAG